MILLSIPNIGETEEAYLRECVRTNFVSSVGPFVDRFEIGVASLHGGTKGVATSAGTTALHVGLVALGVQPGDMVICPSFTFVATANAIAHQHAVPWLMDVNSGCWTLDPDVLEAELKTKTRRNGQTLVHMESGRKVAAIVPVYTLGTPASMERISAIAAEFQLPILADAAAAIGVTYKGQTLNDLADLTSFSFNGNKTITTGGGGMLIGKNAEALALARHLSTTARTSPDYDYDRVGYNYRMTNIQAAIGCAQLERLPSFLMRKRQVRDRYNDAFRNRRGITLFPQPQDLESACWFSGLVLDPVVQPPIKDICVALKADGIEARSFWKPLHEQKPYQHCPRSDLTVTESFWRNVITLPCSTMITDAELEKTVEAVDRILV